MTDAATRAADAARNRAARAKAKDGIARVQFDVHVQNTTDALVRAGVFEEWDADNPTPATVQATMAVFFIRDLLDGE